VWTCLPPLLFHDRGNTKPAARASLNLYRLVALAFAIAIALLVFLPTAAQADNCVTAASGFSSDYRIWDGCGLSSPDPGDNATINLGHTVTMDGQDGGVLNLTVLGTLYLQDYRFGVAAGGSLVNKGLIWGTWAAAAGGGALVSAAQPDGECRDLGGNSRIYFYGDTLTNDGTISVMGVAFCGSGTRRLGGSGSWRGTDNSSACIASRRRPPSAGTISRNYRTGPWAARSRRPRPRARDHPAAEAGRAARVGGRRGGCRGLRRVALRRALPGPARRRVPECEAAGREHRPG
jgi:hypothetical protein